MLLSSTQFRKRSNKIGSELLLNLSEILKIESLPSDDVFLNYNSMQNILSHHLFLIDFCRGLIKALC